MRRHLAVLVLLAACGRSKPPVSVELSYFGEVKIADGQVAFMDGGTHDVAGHGLLIDADGRATWGRSEGSLSRDGRAGKGGFELEKDERAKVERWRDALWAAAPTGKTDFHVAGPSFEMPRHVWAVVMRRGDEIRVVQGSRVPALAREPLEWLRERVDALVPQPVR